MERAVLSLGLSFSLTIAGRTRNEGMNASKAGTLHGPARLRMQ
jgi:hypothetical protein